MDQHLGPTTLYWKAQSWAQFQRSGPSEGPCEDELGQFGLGLGPNIKRPEGCVVDKKGTFIHKTLLCMILDGNMISCDEAVVRELVMHFIMLYIIGIQISLNSGQGCKSRNNALVTGATIGFDYGPPSGLEGEGPRIKRFPQNQRTRIQPPEHSIMCIPWYCKRSTLVLT